MTDPVTLTSRACRAIAELAEIWDADARIRHLDGGAVEAVIGHRQYAIGESGHVCEVIFEPVTRSMREVPVG